VTNIHDRPQEGHVCNEQVNAIQLEILADYNHHMGYVNKGDRMMYTYSTSHWTWKWMKNLFFHLFDLVILNSYILRSS
jgi:hypothetical protein